MIDEQVERILRVLDDVMRLSDHSLRSIERQCGFGQSYLSQILSGRSDLKLPVLLKVLELLGVHPLTFFSIVWKDAPPPKGTDQHRIEERLETAEALRSATAGPERATPRAAEVPPELAWLTETIKGVVEETLAERGAGRSTPKRSSRKPAGRKLRQSPAPPKR